MTTKNPIYQLPSKSNLNKFPNATQYIITTLTKTLSSSGKDYLDTSNRVSLHCWNHTTFSRISEVWGKLLFLGENANQTIDAVEITLLIETNQIKKIEEVINLEVGKESFWIQVEELGFRNHVVVRKEQNENEKRSSFRKVEMENNGSSSDSLSEVSRSNVLMSKVGASRMTEDETIHLVCLGKNIKVGGSVNELDKGRFVGESDILGKTNKGTVSKEGPSGVDASIGLDSRECVGRMNNLIHPSSKARIDLLTMGFKNNELTRVVDMESESEEAASDIVEDRDIENTLDPTLEPLVNNEVKMKEEENNFVEFLELCLSVRSMEFGGLPLMSLIVCPF
ncbi:hypothetical protein V6N13_084981 [Hibiscus sabdariffa]